MCTVMVTGTVLQYILFIIIVLCVSDCHVIILSCYYRTPVDRDYKMTEQNCSQVMTHYRGHKFGFLRDVTVTLNDEILIVDYDNKCVVVFDNKLNLLKVIGQGSGNSRLVNPEGIAVTDNVIAVSDYGSHQVKEYSLQGELLSVIGCKGNKNGQFNHPVGLAFNNNNELYVVDHGNHRVQVFQQDDTFAFSFGNGGSNPGQFQDPVRIAIDPNNNVLVTDFTANCINIFTDRGQFIQTINSDRPWAITISPTGYLITGHYGDDNKIRVWSPTYHLINQFGKMGSKLGEYYGIAAVSMDSSGNIYVVESHNKRLQVII